MGPSTIAQVPARKLTQPLQRCDPFGLSRYWADALLTFRRPRISCRSPSSNGRGVIGGAAQAGSAAPASAAPQRVFPIKLRREMDSLFECSLTGVLLVVEGPFAVSWMIKTIDQRKRCSAHFRLFLQRGQADRSLRSRSAKRWRPPTKSGQPYYLFFPPPLLVSRNARSSSFRPAR
jgi:hypothetical protein